MRMLTWMCGYIRRDMLKNKDIWDKVGVTSVADQMRKVRLRLFIHVKRKIEDASVRRRVRLVEGL